MPLPALYQVVMAGPIAFAPGAEPDQRQFIYVWLQDQNGHVQPCFATPAMSNPMLAVALAAMARQAPVAASFAASDTPHMPMFPDGLFQLYSIYLVAVGGPFDPPYVAPAPPDCSALQRAWLTLYQQLQTLQAELASAIGPAKLPFIEEIAALTPQLNAARIALDRCQRGDAASTLRASPLLSPAELLVRAKNRNVIGASVPLARSGPTKRSKRSGRK